MDIKVGKAYQTGNLKGEPGVPITIDADIEPVCRKNGELRGCSTDQPVEAPAD